jgi:hypothetical protein
MSDDVYPGPGAAPSAETAMTLSEERLAQLFRVYFYMMLTVTAWFTLWLLSARAGTWIANFGPVRLWIGEYPAGEGRLHVAMSLSLMVVLLTMAWRIAEEPRLNRGLVPIFALSKGVSAAGFVVAMLFDGFRGLYVGGALIDGLMGWLAWQAYLEATGADQVSAWPEAHETQHLLPRPPLDFDVVAGATDRQRELWMRISAGPAIDGLLGYEWKGMNTPAWARLLGIKKFVKGIRKDGEAGRPAIYGYNIPIDQDGRQHSTDAWHCKPSDERPKRFGFYAVSKVIPGSRDSAYPKSVLLDYGAAEKPWFDFTSVLRDYVVQPDPQNPDVLLGKALVALGPLRVPVSYFVLQRWRVPPDIGPGQRPTVATHVDTRDDDPADDPAGPASDTATRA